METSNIMSILKWKELAEVEKYLDTPMDEWQNMTSKADLSFAMQYIMAKRNNPALTITEAEELSIQELTDLAGVEIDSPKEETPA
jgi:hypothetical protein